MHKHTHTRRGYGSPQAEGPLPVQWCLSMTGNGQTRPRPRLSLYREKERRGYVLALSQTVNLTCMCLLPALLQLKQNGSKANRTALGLTEKEHTLGTKILIKGWTVSLIFGLELGA